MKKLLLICLMGVVLTGCSGDKDVDKQKAENHTDVVQEVESQDTVETDDGTVEGNQLNEVSTGIAPEAGETNGVDKAPAKPVEDTEADIEDAVNSTAPVQDGTAEDNMLVEE